MAHNCYVAFFLLFRYEFVSASPCRQMNPVHDQRFCPDPEYPARHWIEVPFFFARSCHSSRAREALPNATSEGGGGGNLRSDKPWRHSTQVFRGLFNSVQSVMIPSFRVIRQTKGEKKNKDQTDVALFLQVFFEGELFPPPLPSFPQRIPISPLSRLTGMSTPFGNCPSDAQLRPASFGCGVLLKMKIGPSSLRHRAQA